MTERPLRVAVDARCLNTQHLRGMGKSLFELVRRTSAAGAVEWHLFGDRPDLPVHSPSPSVPFSLFETTGYRFHAWEQFGLPFKIWRMGRPDVDMLHAPGTVMPWWQPVPAAVTIHDTIPWTRTNPARTKGVYWDHLLPDAYRRARAIITISECSRRDIIALWPHLEPRMHVVPPGVDERYLSAAMESGATIIGGQAVTEPYLLYFGGRDPRKRLDWAIDVWQAVAATGVSLIACGLEPDIHDRVRQSIPQNLRDRLILAPFVDEASMPQLYMRAAAVLYPSLYEGFGLPVVESQAVGTPVLFSDVGSLSELKGPGAHVLPLHDMRAWVTAVSAAVNARRDGHHPNEAARRWARQFSWDVYTQRTLAVYRAICQPGRKEARIPKRTLRRIAP
jgi:glycosyltransferase involved in cell wall biosynthesis